MRGKTIHLGCYLLLPALPFPHSGVANRAIVGAPGDQRTLPTLRPTHAGHHMTRESVSRLQIGCSASPWTFSITVTSLLRRQRDGRRTSCKGPRVCTQRGTSSADLMLAQPSAWLGEARRVVLLCTAAAAKYQQVSTATASLPTLCVRWQWERREKEEAWETAGGDGMISNFASQFSQSAAAAEAAAAAAA